MKNKPHPDQSLHPGFIDDKDDGQTEFRLPAICKGCGRENTNSVFTYNSRKCSYIALCNDCNTCRLEEVDNISTIIIYGDRKSVEVVCCKSRD